MSNSSTTSEPTWKVVSFLKRRSGMSRDEFTDYWRDVHAPLMQQQDDFWRHVRKYVQNYAVGDSESPVGLARAHDGVAELLFESPEEVMSAFREPGFQNAVKADVKNFVDLDGSVSWVAEVVPVKDFGPAKITLYMAGHVKRGLTREDGQAYWRDNHPQLIARETPEFWSMLTRYVQNHTRPSEGVALDTITDQYDMSAEIGADSVEALEAAFARADYMAIVRPDELKFASPEDALSLVTRPSVIYDSSR